MILADIFQVLPFIINNSKFNCSGVNHFAPLFFLSLSSVNPSFGQIMILDDMKKFGIAQWERIILEADDYSSSIITKRFE